jgi:ElaB/YqjD/DUF883 family membrane-anchored ribosome-binding protein
VTTVKTFTENASELGREAKESIEELGRSAGKRLDRARDETAGALHSAACSVRNAGQQGSEAIDDLAKNSATRLDATAAYVGEHDLRSVLTDLRRFGRRHLTVSLVAAATVGFLAGSAVRRMTHSCAKSSEGESL